MYRKLINPTENEVSKLLKEKYLLHSVSVLPGNRESLIYHFVKIKMVHINNNIEIDGDSWYKN